MGVQVHLAVQMRGRLHRIAPMCENISEVAPSFTQLPISGVIFGRAQPMRNVTVTGSHEHRIEIADQADATA